VLQEGWRTYEEIIAKEDFQMNSCSKKSVARSLHSKTVSILCGILLTPLANVAVAAEAKDVVLQILGEAIPQLQNTMASMSQGCSGGSGGVPPLNWQSRQAPGNSAVNTLGNARVALAAAQTSDAGAMQQVKQQINSGLSQWDTLISSLERSCSGGSGGENPVNYGSYVQFRNQLKAELQTAMRFL
jgi:hypothetical protein